MFDRNSTLSKYLQAKFCLLYLLKICLFPTRINAGVQYYKLFRNVRNVWHSYCLKNALSGECLKTILICRVVVWRSVVA